MKKVLIIVIILLALFSSAVIFSVVQKFCNSPASRKIDRSKIRIEIINCSGIEKQAQKTQEFLRNCGFDVYELRTGKRVIDKTTVIERINPELANAKEVAEAMANKQKIWILPITQKYSPEVQKDIDSLLYLEVTVVLGRDAEKLIMSSK